MVAEIWNVRYNLERLSHNMGEVSYVNMNRPIMTGYYPTMHFRNGVSFPQRRIATVVPTHMQKHVQVISTSPRRAK